jgi:putative transposase
MVNALTLMSDFKTYYRRHLPHYQPPDATYHVVFRLANSLPESALAELRMERVELDREPTAVQPETDSERSQQERHRRYIERFDGLLDGSTSGPRWLQRPEIASIVHEAIRYRDGKAYDLLAHCIMPNHVHIVFKVERPDRSSVVSRLARVNRVDKPGNSSNIYLVTNILSSLKKYTARKANKLLGRRGAFWQHESYDRVIRDSAELERTIRYVLRNPVKAGLVGSAEEWPWMYIKPTLR